MDRFAPSRPERRPDLVVLASVAFVASFALWQITGWGGPRLAPWIDSLFFFPPGLIGAGLGLRNARHRGLDRRTRRAWAIYSGATLLVWASAQLWGYRLILDPRAPAPWWVDAATLSCAPFYLWSLLSFPAAPRDRSERTRFGADALIVVLGGGLVTWYLTVLAGVRIEGWQDAVTTLAQPIGDYVLLTGCAVLIVRRPRSVSRRAVDLLVVSQSVAALGDLVYAVVEARGHYYPGHPVDILWMLAWPVAWAAARAQTRSADAALLAPVPADDDAAAQPYVDDSWLSYAFVALSFAVLLLAMKASLRTSVGAVAFCTMGITALLLVRQRLAQRANALLYGELNSSENRYRHLFDQNPCPMWVFDVESRRILDVNAAAARHYGYDRDEFLALTINDLHASDDGTLVDELLATVPRTRHEPAAMQHVKKNGAVIDVEVTSDALMLGGRPARLALANDVTARRALEAELQHQAFHDSLTGLPNRARFRERVDRALGRADQPPGSVAVIFLDLDDFKTVNDSLGHAAGDRLLVQVAERLLNATRGCDTVARLGGDEFAVLIQHVRCDADAQVVAERAAAALVAPFQLDGHRVPGGASIGVARAQPADGTEELLRNADLAMYRAKAGGKRGVALFAPEMHAAVLSRMELEDDLRTALRTGQFSLAFQPVVDLRTSAPTGAEALVRWRHPRRGNVSPAEFIPVAEETGLIVALGRWVLEEACREAARWPACPNAADHPEDGAPFTPSRRGATISVNVSGRQLVRPQFVDDVAAVLASTGLAPARLVLEITESVLLDRTDVILERLTALKALGVGLAVDDFGTGYSSLAYLHRFPVDVLKIDKAFVDAVGRGSTHDALLRTIIALGQTLGLNTVAEGVEHAEQHRLLVEFGCSSAQGYLFARPLDAAALRAAWGIAPRDAGVAAPADALPGLRPRRAELVSWPE